MSRGYKFSAFAGVYTPSLLTILGVIMYMRLGWIVGQAGLLISLVIILISHIISFTTALSISSIATDKKIKAGGIYYILSRSLGLSMGGAIGIALAIGMALSISMYIVGFSENFLSIKLISNFLGLSLSTNSIRIVGSAILAILTILALISTSLAIKTQYFILGAIALSLISIFVGFGVNIEFHPQSPLWSAAEGHLPFETIFAIFFPAVTGFTAGVAMSGDLRDPKKDIPRGTMAAIATGLVIYIGLAVGYSIFVKREVLLNDTNIAMNIAWLPSLVVAGIWGATLSSALGGILGAPRILQALSADNITPAIFGKTYGKNNEPRAALVIIYLIAQGGILIGDLNAIAGIVTMFYLTSYGFINLAYVLESWANTDFRPSFRIPLIIGIIGFIFAFTVMLRIDMLSMLSAFFIIGSIYFYLQRRQLKLEGGDVWRSVWISIIRRGLSALISMPENDQNWQPNIILLTGGTKKRAYLLEFAQSLVGHYGFLTNFDLIVNKEAEVLFPKYQQNYLDRHLQKTGIFFRRLTVKDLYQGIEMIVRSYGFSGLEPNTVILGWARNTENPKKFVHLLKIIHKLDYNLILIDYDNRYGFGDYKQIDIWWRGAGNNGNFALMLSKLMTMNEPWKNALIRLLIVNDEDSKAFYLYRRANDMLTNMRIKAIVKIINNEVEKLSFYDIVRRESKTADIVFIGLPEIPSGQEHLFIERTNRLLFEIGTVALVRASKVFKDLNLGINLNQKPILTQSNKLNKKPIIAQEKLIETSQEEVNKFFSTFYQKLDNIFETTIQTFIYSLSDNFIDFLAKLSKTIPQINDLIALSYKQLNNQQRQRYILRYQNYLILLINRKIQQFKSQSLNDIIDELENLIMEARPNLETLVNSLPPYFKLSYYIQDKNLIHNLTKLSHNIEYKQKQVIITFYTKKLIYFLHSNLLELLHQDIERIRVETLRFTFNFEKYIHTYIEQLEEIKEKDIENFSKIINNTSKNISSLISLIQDMPKRISHLRKQFTIKTINNILEHFSLPQQLLYFKKINNKKNKRFLNQRINNEVTIFFESLNLYLNHLQISNYDLIFRLNLRQYLKELKNSIANTKEINPILNEITKMTNAINKIILLAPNNLSVMDAESLNESFYKNFTHITTKEINLRSQLKKFFSQEIIEKLLTILNHYISLNQNAKNELEQKIEQIKENLKKAIIKL